MQTKDVWICDFRTNTHFTLRQNPEERWRKFRADDIIENLESALESFRELKRQLGKNK